MPRNGSGTYRPPSSSWYPAVDGQNAETDDWNSLAADLSDAISDSISADGQTPVVANIPMSGFKFTGLGAGSANGNSIRYEQVNGLLNANTAGVTISSGLLWGLTLSNNASDATNDIDIAAGISIDSTNSRFMTVASSYTKQLDAAWAVGTNQGFRDTGSIANGTWHVFEIMRSDTGVVDFLASLSATAPTMPANYDYKRRIGSILREGGVIVAFVQDGDLFMRKTSVADISAANPGTSAVTRTLSVPLGLRLQVIFLGLITSTTLTAAFAALFTDLSLNDVAATASNSQAGGVTGSVAATYELKGSAHVMSNTSGQVRSRMRASDANTTLVMNTQGWIDTRGRLAA